MIRDHDRSGWFGASDVQRIMGSWSGRTFDRWWMQKLGLNRDHFSTDAMAAGTHYEHPILRAVGAREMDRQLYVPEYRLRVNLDGNTGGHILEAKTHRHEKPYRPPLAHVRQVNVQIFAALQNGWRFPTGEIVAYGLLPYEYENFFAPIDPERLRRFPVRYDPDFILAFQRRLRVLCDCMLDGRWPDAAEIPDGEVAG